MKKFIFIYLAFCLLFLSGCNLFAQDKTVAKIPASGEKNTEVVSEPPPEQPAEQPEQPAEQVEKPEQPAEQPADNIPESSAETTPAQPSPTENNTPQGTSGKIIVLDPGHGKSSSAMTDDEKINAGYIRHPEKGWGEWRHFKCGTMWQDCCGSGCNGRAPANGGCWYPITHGDRDTEPELAYNNALSAKKYLEQYGYTVRMTRNENENPSLTSRIRKCYPGDNINAAPDADAYVCIHSNAGGGSGSYYIALSGTYDHSGMPAGYIESGNQLGKSINDSIVSNTAISACGSGRYDSYPELVLFFKSPVPVAYLEIGFYDNQNDLEILRTQSDSIGKAIADGIHNYFTNTAE